MKTESDPSLMASSNAEGPKNLSRNTVLTEGSWKDILDEIDKLGSFVTLDLSACTRSSADTGGGLRADGIFDPLPGNINGKSKIVSLVLPIEAVGITDAIYHYDSYLQFIWISVFKSFRSLKTVSGAGIENIESSAFKNCKTITSVDFPAVNNIGEFSFAGCTALASVNFPQARRIDTLAFQNCTALVDVRFPKILSLNKAVFEGCTSLVNVEFPVANSFGVNTFENTGSKALTIILGNSAPSLWGSLFDGVSTEKSVTVKIPDGAAGYDSYWTDSFVGENDNINVLIDTYTVEAGKNA